MGSRHVEQNINIKRQHSKQSLHWGSYSSLVLVQEVGVSGQGSLRMLEVKSQTLSLFFAHESTKLGQVYKKGLWKGFGVNYTGYPDKEQRIFQIVLTCIFLLFPLSGQCFHSFQASYLGFSFRHFDSPEVIWVEIFYLSPIWCECW